MDNGNAQKRAIALFTCFWKVLEIAMDLISVRNIDGVVQVLKREVLKTQDKNLDKSDEYRHLLIKTIHSCAIKFPSVAGPGDSKNAVRTIRVGRRDMPQRGAGRCIAPRSAARAAFRR